MSSLTLEIRNASRDDAAALSSVHESAWRGAYAGLIPGLSLTKMLNRRGPLWWARLAERTRGGLIALDLGSEVIGYATLGSVRPVSGVEARGEIFELYVKPEYQGLGFGSRLLSTALDRLAFSGRRPALVWALAENEAAMQFYKKQGGRIVVRGTERFGETSLCKFGFIFQN